MRLIDADLLIKNIEAKGFCKEDVLDEINNQPTAYDVDKVVERLENEPSCGFGFKGLYTKRAIEIVKGGVKVNKKEIKMTIEQAIIILNDLRGDVIKDRILKHALGMAISALKKQIPKKPREHYNWCDLSEDERLETSRWYCETCDGAIEENYNYCPDCGQALDWSGDDE